MPIREASSLLALLVATFLCTVHSLYRLLRFVAVFTCVAIVHTSAESRQIDNIIVWCFLFFCPDAGLNKASSTIVERTLVDDVLWYRSVVLAIQRAEPGAKLSEGQLCKKVRDEFVNVRRHSQFFFVQHR